MRDREKNLYKYCGNLIIIKIFRNAAATYLQMNHFENP